MVLSRDFIITMTRNLWKELCTYDNLFLAYKKARKHKTLKNYVIEFRTDLEKSLLFLQTELFLHSYKPRPLVNFTVHDPKTRKISKSDFRDRVIHHALCNIIEPIFEKSFIYDSFANRKTKGTLKAIERFDYFKRRLSKNNTKRFYVLKADIKRYFESVNHSVLIEVIKKKIEDKNILWLIKKILKNSISETKPKGMPLGNLTSQFFANVYLNELDYFVKRKLKAKYYIRYVDDFVILHTNKKFLKSCKRQINQYLKENLKIELHPDKSKIILFGKRITFLGFRMFYNYKLLKKSNIRNMRFRYNNFKGKYQQNKMNYDKIYDFMEGWIAYSKNANTCKSRKKILNNFEEDFNKEVSTKEVNRLIKNPL